MIITYHGKQFFKIQKGDKVYAVNPISKDSKLKKKPAKFGSDVVLCTVRHPDYNGFENATYNDKTPFRIYGPGSYEIDEDSFVGFESPAIIGNESWVNTIYFFNLDAISFCFLGDLSSEKIDQKIAEYTESVDVIFVPIGGEGTLDPVAAAKIVKHWSPKVIIPMDYTEGRESKALETFLKETSSTDVKPEPKYVFKKKDIEGLNGQVVVVSEQ